jgi:hypothetical protein
VQSFSDSWPNSPILWLGDWITLDAIHMLPALPHQESVNARQRWVSLSEFLVGGAIVIAHNVYHRVPNEVPILRGNNARQLVKKFT